MRRGPVRPRPARGPLLALCATAALLAGCRGEQPERWLLPDLEGRLVDPLAAAGDRVSVFLFTRTDCPISNRYAPEIRRLRDRLAPRGVAFWLVYPAGEPAGAVRRHVEDYGYRLPVLLDPRHTLVAATGVTVTPEAAVFTAGGDLVYRGRIDDRFVDFGEARAAATVHDLKDAVEAVLDGRPVADAVTPAVGCFIEALP